LGTGHAGGVWVFPRGVPFFDIWILSRTVPGCPGEACPASPGNLEILKISFFGHL